MYCVNFGSAVFGESCIHRIPTLGSLLEYNGVNTSGVRFLLSVCHKISGLALLPQVASSSAPAGSLARTSTHTWTTLSFGIC